MATDATTAAESIRGLIERLGGAQTGVR